MSTNLLISLRNINGLRVMGKPDACVVAVDSPVFNIYRVSDAMGAKGWHLSPLQFPSRYSNRSTEYSFILI